MILSDRQILSAIAEGRIVFDPPLTDDELQVALTTSALDLRLGSELVFLPPVEDIYPKGMGEMHGIDPTVPGVIQDLVGKWGRKESIAGSHYDIQPGEFVLGATHEVVSLPESHKLAARVEGKSTLARLGFVVHMTAPTIHCGFAGTIVLEMYNYGPYPIKLTDKMRICQLIFEELGEGPAGAQATQYMGQSGLTE